VPQPPRKLPQPQPGTEQEHVLRFILLNAGGAKSGAKIRVITADELADGRVRHKRETEEIRAAITQQPAGHRSSIAFMISSAHPTALAIPLIVAGTCFPPLVTGSLVRLS